MKSDGKMKLFYICLISCNTMHLFISINLFPKIKGSDNRDV